MTGLPTIIPLEIIIIIKKSCCCYNANYTASGYINGCNIIMLNPLLKKKTPLHFTRNFRDLIVSLSQL